MLDFTIVNRDNIEPAGFVRITVFGEISLRHADYFTLLVSRDPECGMSEFRGLCGFDFAKNKCAVRIFGNAVDFAAPGLIITRYDCIAERKQVLDCGIFAFIPFLPGSTFGGGRRSVLVHWMLFLENVQDENGRQDHDQ
jgi:hypothetical protein